MVNKGNQVEWGIRNMYMRNCDIYQLKKIVEDKKLVCFGMGKVFYDFLEDFPEMEFEKDIWMVVDSKVEMDGKLQLPNGISVKVMNPKKLIELKDIIILISCADIAGVYTQLVQYRLSDDIACYAVYYVRSQTNRTDEKVRKSITSFKITKDQRIPKKIHYCWFGNHPIPEKNLRWIESWKKYCPDYEIIQWNENNYDITKNVYMYEAYKQKKWGFVPDYARMDIVYRYGGIYLDTDVELVKSYDELLYQPAFCGIEANRKIALGLGFGAEIGCPILKELMDLYENIHFIDKYGNNSLKTCVTLQYPFFKRKGFINNGSYQIVDGMSVYPEKVFSPKDFYTGETEITEHTFSIHHYDASWVDEKTHNRIKATNELFQKIKV